ncbi:MAG: DUF167 family protein [Alphaproteobacteria bacterium]|nr:DUF167 family protein [Alphaproteobacteria bacterium]
MTGQQDGWVRSVPGGLSLCVRLTPKSSRDGFDGVGHGADGRIFVKARVRAAPEKGKANKALIALLAKRTGLAATRITLTSGATSRLKTLLVQGDDLSAIDLAARVFPSPDGTCDR